MTLSTMALRSSGTLSGRPRPSQQTRSFRFGVWSSYLDQNFQKELQRRHINIGDKYIEALNRKKLPWDRQLPDYAKNVGLKSFMCSARLGRWVRNDLLDDMNIKGKPEKRPRSEEVEENVFEKVFGRKEADFIQGKSRTRRLRHGHAGFPFDRVHDSSFPNFSGGEKGRFDNHARNQSNSPSYEEYEIDPITNRKVYKNPTNQAYEIDPITNRKVYKNPTNTTDSNHRKPIEVPVKTFEGYRSQFSSFEPPTGTTESSQKGEPQDLSGTSQHREHDIPTKAKSKEYDAHTFYDQPFAPEGKNPKKVKSVQDGLDPYETKMSYLKSSMAYQPDGNLSLEATPDPVNEGYKAYDSEMSYDKPFLAHEPDGKYATPEGRASADDKVESFDAKKSYLKSSMAYDPKSQLPVEETSDPVEEGYKAYDSQMSYDKPFMAYEPDGQPPKEGESETAFESVKAYGADKQAYTESNPDPDREFLKAYEAKHPYPRSQAELKRWDTELNQDLVGEGIKRHDSDHSYEPAYYNKPFGKEKRPMTASDAQKTANPIPNQGSSAKLISRKDILDTAFKRQQDILKSTFSRAEARVPQQVLEGLKSQAFNEESFADSKKGEALAGKPTNQSAQKMTGNFVRDFPNVFEAKWAPSKTGSGALVPEEMESSQQSRGQSVKSTLESQEDIENKIQNAEKEYVDCVVSKQSFSRRPDTPRLQTSLDRNNTHSKRSPKPSQSSDYEPAMHQGEGDLSELVSSYGAAREDYSGDRLSSATRTVGGKSVQEPTIYKILFYDPTMQEVNIAETTSTVPNSTSPLTPPEVLERLSNPSKFFPYFETLRSQGYEIVSGSGDILVFHKAHTSASPPAEPKRKSTNPIDGMQTSPVAATGNFASPTGFVNHDLPTRADHPFKSNVDVRCEEPVLSGKRNWNDKDESRRRKTPGVGRRLITGAVWVGACAYTLGVAAEYFKTGGSGGLGPRGL